MSERHPAIVRADDLPWTDGPPHDDRFGSRIRRLGQATGAQRLQCSMYEVEPGKKAFPHHYHYTTEEAYFILSGSGTVRIGDGQFAVAAGDYVAAPCGPAHAHQLINTGTEPLRYLCMSSYGADADVCVYPDSGKVGAYAGDGPPDGFRAVFKVADQAGYFDDE